MSSVAARVQSVRAEAAKFGVVGAVALLVDLGTFNLARLVLHLGPLTSKTVSVTVAAAAAYAGNRWWTYRHHQRPPLVTGFVLYAVLNAAGLVIALTCLATSHYLLGLTSTLADNLSANGAGLALGTAFRFWAYPRFVFRRTAPEQLQPDEPGHQHHRDDHEQSGPGDQVAA